MTKTIVTGRDNGIPVQPPQSYVWWKCNLTRKNGQEISNNRFSFDTRLLDIFVAVYVNITDRRLKMSKDDGQLVKLNYSNTILTE